MPKVIFKQRSSPKDLVSFLRTLLSVLNLKKSSKILLLAEIKVWYPIVSFSVYISSLEFLNSMKQYLRPLLYYKGYYKEEGVTSGGWDDMKPFVLQNFANCSPNTLLLRCWSDALTPGGHRTAVIFRWRAFINQLDCYLILYK